MFWILHINKRRILRKTVKAGVMQIKLQYFIAIIILITGCDSDNGAHFTNDIIAVGQVSPHSLVKVFVGYLNKNADRSYGQGPYKPIEDAIVQVIRNGQIFPLVYVNPHDNDDYRDYQDINHLIDVNAGDTLYLVVTTIHDTLEAETVVPSTPTIFFNDGDTVTVQIIERATYNVRPFFGIKDRGQLKIKGTTDISPDKIRSFHMSFILPSLLGPTLFSFKDSALMDVIVDTGAVLVPNIVSLTAFDDASSENESLLLNFDIELIEFEADVQNFMDQLNAKKLAERTNIKGGLGFWGAVTSTSKHIVMKIQR